MTIDLLRRRVGDVLVVVCALCIDEMEPNELAGVNCGVDIFTLVGVENTADVRRDFGGPGER